MRVIALVGGHLCGAMLPPTRTGANGVDYVEVASKTRPGMIDVWERAEGQSIALYRGRFARKISAYPETRDN